MGKAGPARETGPVDSDFDLTAFFPYRMAVLAEQVSQAISQVYLDRFELSRAEWRVLAALGSSGAMAARDIGPYSTLDKMQVSRAVARLEQEGLIQRAEDSSDARAKIISLTAAGHALYHRIVPLAQARETYLLEALAPEERKALRTIMDRLQERAESLIARG
jgi:DNA-binding MarR family transcriptional regulator